MSFLIAAFVGLTILAPPVAAEACDTILGCGEDLQWALDGEAQIADNIWDGQVYEIDYTAGLPRERANVRSVNGFGDSALWTGTYLASQSFRYATAKKYLANPSLPADKVAFWQAQKAEAKSRVDAIVNQYHVLINISGNWDHKFQPSTAQAGFGGGLVKGEPGYLMRACRPVEAPEYTRWSNTELGPDPSGMPRPYTANRRIFGPLKFRGYDGVVRSYWCEDGTSRDAYAGVTFGMLTAFDLVSRDDPLLRRHLRDDFVTLANFAFKYLWTTPRPHGRISIPVGSNYRAPPCSDINAIVSICGHDFENFVSPLFVITPFARMNLTMGAYHVTQKNAGHPDTLKWSLILDEEIATQGPMLAGSMVVDTFQPYESYYKHNLSHLIGYNFTTRAPNPTLKGLFKSAVGVMDHSTGDDINAHFETITYGLTGEKSRRDAAVQHLREWREYRTRVETGVPTNNLQFCGSALDCVPQDQQDVTLPGGAATVVVPGRSTSLRAHKPLPVAQRAPSDFIWQRPGTQLNGGDPATHRAPGIDYLLPYWMLRYHTEVAVPSVQPFKPWVGPAFN